MSIENNIGLAGALLVAVLYLLGRGQHEHEKKLRENLRKKKDPEEPQQ